MARQSPKDKIEKVAPEPTSKKNSTNLEKKTIRLHPDVWDAIEKKAAADRRKPADVFRDLLAKGLNSEGIYL